MSPESLLLGTVPFDLGTVSDRFLELAIADARPGNSLGDDILTALRREQARRLLLKIGFRAEGSVPIVLRHIDFAQTVAEYAAITAKAQVMIEAIPRCPQFETDLISGASMLLALAKVLQVRSVAMASAAARKSD